MVFQKIGLNAQVQLYNNFFPNINYHTAGKLGGENVWQIYFFQAFGEKSLANENISQKVINYKYKFEWL